ncbi:hypothetical protein [Neotabrizicola shimadae]|uniref:Uncharacterized protein n=1 Tax=Neotabrizicola shimadae TaxID=2807096 RepID=A0A8G1EE04_9RHOB|nr:hypothetical protein [Neotabrizicola shimadae]QYZ69989.1 hypothetical protein JO391_00130 [Neotabrizicola shimadae]
MTQAHPAHRSLRRRLVAAAQHGLILFLYLWVLFGLFVLNEVAFDREHQNHAALQGFALINALALTKAMMLVEHMELSGRLSHLPKIYSILFDAAFCAAAFMIVHVVERVALGLFQGQSFSASMPVFGGGGSIGVLIIALIAFVSLLPFFTFKAVARAFGPDKVRAALLSWPEVGDRATLASSGADRRSRD